jgi:very-short-patch-repair endonuclease
MVRSSRIRDQKFRREYPLGPYTLDFVCLNLKLNIEVDGAPHLTDEGMKRDRRRDEYLRSQGFAVLRFTGFQVLHESAQVHHAIETAVDRRIEQLRGE